MNLGRIYMFIFHVFHKNTHKPTTVTPSHRDKLLHNNIVNLRDNNPAFFVLITCYTQRTYIGYILYYVNILYCILFASVYGIRYGSIMSSITVVLFNNVLLLLHFFTVICLYFV